jgi:uncharacterized protein (DUF362 family)
MANITLRGDEVKVVVSRVEELGDGIKRLLEDIRWREAVSTTDRVLIKPNLLTRPKRGVTTNPALIGGVVEALKERAEDVAVVETDSTGRRLEPVAKKLKLDCKIINLSKTEKTRVTGIYGSYLLPALVLDSKVVNLPVLKTHVLTRLTMALKNLFGLIPAKDKEPYHWRINQTLCDLYGIIKPEINILDATFVMDGDGPTDGRVREAGYIVASRDALALDLAVLELLGIRKAEVRHLDLAARHYPVEYEVKGDAFDLRGFEVPEVGRLEMLAALLQHYAVTRFALRQPLIRNAAKKVKTLAEML